MPQSDPAPPLRRILLAEDEPHVRRILRSVLEGEFDIDVADRRRRSLCPP